MDDEEGYNSQPSPCTRYRFPENMFYTLYVIACKDVNVMKMFYDTVHSRGTSVAICVICETCVIRIWLRRKKSRVGIVDLSMETKIAGTR